MLFLRRLLLAGIAAGLVLLGQVQAAHIVVDSVAENSTTTGTGAFTLAGALTSYRTFASVCSTGDTVPYTIRGVDGSGNLTGEWETGLGTYSATNTLTRTTVYASSNAGSAVSFASGSKYVFLSPVAREMQFSPTVILASDSTNSTTTLADVTGMSFSAVASGVYIVDLTGFYQTAATTTGIAVALNGPSGTSVYGINIIATSATAIAGTNQIANGATAGASTGVTTATTDTPILARWVVKVGGTAGTVQLQMKSEVASSAATLKAGATVLTARKVN